MINPEKRLLMFCCYRNRHFCVHVFNVSVQIPWLLCLQENEQLHFSLLKPSVTQDHYRTVISLMIWEGWES